MTDALRAELVTLDDLQAATRVLHGVAVCTPLLPVNFLRDQFPDGVWVKPETLQRTGAFKFRGAYTFLAGMNPAERARTWPGLMQLIADVPPYSA